MQVGERVQAQRTASGERFVVIGARRTVSGEGSVVGRVGGVSVVGRMGVGFSGLSAAINLEHSKSN